jgi:putative hydrolase of the HAD superfamily
VRATPWFLWTDFGGVLTPPVGETLTAYCRSVGVAPVDLHAAALDVARAYGVDDIMAPLDTPIVAEDEWRDQVELALVARLGRSIDLGDIGRAWFAGRAVNAEWLAELRRVRSAGIGVGMLSNMPPSWDARWRAMVAEDEFDCLLLSFEVATRKPQREIFEIAAEKAGVAAERCILVDDSEVNCAGARGQGWTALPFTDTTRAIAQLRAVIRPPIAGFPPLNPQPIHHEERTNERHRAHRPDRAVHRHDPDRALRRG